MKWASIEPKSGVVQIYPPDCQTMLDQLLSGSESVYLGDRCFNATVLRRDIGQYEQRTPAIRVGRGLSKPAGRRSVLRIHDTQTEVRCSYRRDGWHLPVQDDLLTKMAVVIGVGEDMVGVWQWCTELDLQRATEGQWMCYSEDICTQLESQWTHGASFELAVSIGIRNMHICVSRNGHAFYEQVDREHNKRRWVRRTYIPRSQLNELRSQNGQDIPDDVCAICTETFTPDLPITRLGCSHAFHSVCWQLILDRGSPRCCLCRADVI